MTIENLYYFPDKKEQANHFSLSTSHAIDASYRQHKVLSASAQLSSCVSKKSERTAVHYMDYCEFSMLVKV
jgi:hypothetical protein